MSQIKINQQNILFYSGHNGVKSTIEALKTDVSCIVAYCYFCGEKFLRKIILWNSL